MMFNPLAFATPQQREQLEKMQGLTQRIKYIIHTEDSENRVEVTLETDDPEVGKLLPQIREAIVNSLTQMLYQLFAMTGERV